ncbi:MAG: lytic murein transglycosylase [Actinobacteria bacterium]|nr:lytic murein transglycosylase [Actinomycetota bacterium]
MAQPIRPDFNAIDVARFDLVPGGRELALLRLEGRYRSRLARPLFEAALLVDDGLAIHRHEPLPESYALTPSEGDDWAWRVAFAVSLAATEDPETAFALEAGPGLTVDLGRPTLWEPQRAPKRNRGRIEVGRRAAAMAMLVALLATPVVASADDFTIAAVVNASSGHPLYSETCHPIAPEQPIDPRLHCASSGSTSSTTAGGSRGASNAPAKGGSQQGKNAGGQQTSSSTSGKGNKGRSPSPQPSPPPPPPPRPAPSAPPSAPRDFAPRPAAPRGPLYNRDGSPAPSNPTFFSAPAPTNGSIPNFIIEHFRVPIFLLPIYQSAGTQYGIPWQVLAAINEIETDYGRNLSVSSAGAVGWMQFMPSTWARWGVDANGDGKKDPYNPVDAIFAAARYLKASGGDKDIRKAIFAYNHAGWYVDSVMMRAKLLGMMSDGVIDSLTGLTEGRFPVEAPARYADDPATNGAPPKGSASHVVQSDPTRQSVGIYADQGAPVIASADGQIKRIGHSKKLGNFVVLEDVYGNRYTYAGLGSISSVYPVPKKSDGPTGDEAHAVMGHGGPLSPHPQIVTRQRVFAHPSRSENRDNGGLEQMFDEESTQGGFSTYSNLFTPGLGLNARNSTMRPLIKGARVIAGTVLGRVGRPDPTKAAHVNFMIRPAGKGAPYIDPKPLLDGWKLLESTAVYRAKGKNILDNPNVSIGQMLLMPKAQLQKKVLRDKRVKIYPGGRNDIRTGQINRRVLAVLEYLAMSGFEPTVSALKSGHGEFTTSGNVSEHASGNAVDISEINGITVTGHQQRGGIVERAIRKLMTLQGEMKPHQIISLLSLGANTLALPDHYNHIHIGFRPTAGDSKKLGQEQTQILKPGQWADLIARLRQIQNPTVQTSPSPYALPAQ